MPAAVPEPVAQRTGEPLRASRSRQADSTSSAGAAVQRSSAATARPARPPRSRSPRLPAPARWRARELVREFACGDVQADADHGPALLRAALEQDARDLPPRSIQTSFGHLIRGLTAARPAHASHTATAAASGRSAVSGPTPRTSSDISRASPGPRVPRPPLPAAPRRLRPRGDDRSVRGARRRQCPGPRVRGVGLPVVDARAADHARVSRTSASRSSARAALASPRFVASATAPQASS